MAIPENDETYLDRLLTDEQAVGLPHILNLDPDVNVRREDYRSLSDAYNYYLGGGRDAAQADFPIQASGITAQVPATTDLGTGEGGTGITAAGVTPTGLNTPEQQRLIDEGIGLQITPGQPVVAPGEMPVTQAEIDAFNAPATLDSTSTADEIMQDLSNQQAMLNPTGGNIMDEVALTGTQQNALPQEQQDPGFWETARDNFIKTGQDVGNFFKDLGGQGIDIAQLAGTTLLNLAGKALTGVPLLGTALNLVGGAESASGAQQGLVSDQFEEEGVTLDDIGRIQQVGLDYDTPENVMAGYSPGETGIRIGDISVGGGTIQESIVDRLSTLEKTKNEKYDGSFYDANGNPKLNPDTGEPTTLGAREEALKENLNIVARAAGADTITEYDPVTKTAGITLGPGEAGFLDNTSDLVTKEEQDAINLQEAVDAGIQASDDDSGSEMLDTTPTNITTNITSDQIDEFDTTPVTDPDTTTVLGRKVSDGTTMADMTDDVDLDEFDTTPTSTFDAEEEDEIYEPPTETSRPGGDNRDDSRPTPSKPTSSGDNRDDSSKSDNRSSSPAKGGGADMSRVSTGGPPSQSSGLGNYQVQSSGGGGGGGGQDSGKTKIVCSMMNESYGFGSFRNKIWLRHSKNLLPEYEKGYHKIFLPLVNYAKKDGVTNKIVKKTIEHLMVHRTIDIRQESRGKMHLLGRLYRKIFEPICYIIGKYAK